MLEHQIGYTSKHAETYKLSITLWETNIAIDVEHHNF